MCVLQVLSEEVEKRLDIDGMKNLVVPLHMHCGELTLPDLRQKTPRLQRTGSLTLRVPPPPMFQYTLKALGLQHPMVYKFKKQIEENLDAQYSNEEDRPTSSAHTFLGIELGFGEFENSTLNAFKFARGLSGKRTKKDSETYVFFSQYHPFSMSFPAEFTVDGQTYGHAFQYKAYHKAALFGDKAMCQKILQTTDPKEIIKLEPRKINFAMWLEKVEEIAKGAMMHKFSQNEDLKTLLLETGDLYIGEGVLDRVWGIGLHQTYKTKNVLNRENWEGMNLCGKTLMFVRDELKKGHIIDNK